MDVTLAVLCDYATISVDGKLNILGIFDRLDPAALPATIPQMFVVSMYDAASVEAGSSKALRIVMTEQDGKEVFSADQTVVVPAPRAPGERVLMSHVMGISGLVVPRPGDYAIHILIGGEERKRVSLRVTQAAGK